jgi:hypothetical protein
MSDANFNPEPVPTRDDLVARLDLIEAMIAEGRQATSRCGWIFVLWGFVILAALGLEWMHPGRIWNWPLMISLGWVLQFAIFFWERRRERYTCRTSAKGRAMTAIWSMMGVTLALYCFPGIFTHHSGGVAYVAAILMIIGFAHATSAIVLRWAPQGAVAALWWAGGIATFFVTGYWLLAIFAVEMLFGMILFGFYMMYLDRRDRRATPDKAAHA